MAALFGILSNLYEGEPYWRSWDTCGQLWSASCLYCAFWVWLQCDQPVSFSWHHAFLVYHPVSPAFTELSTKVTHFPLGCFGRVLCHSNSKVTKMCIFISMDWVCLKKNYILKFAPPTDNKFPNLLCWMWTLDMIHD